MPKDRPMHIWHGVWGGPDVGLGTVRGGGHGCGLARMWGGTDVGLARMSGWRLGVELATDVGSEP